MNVSLYLCLYTTYFIFIAWSCDQSIDFIMNGGVKMEGLLINCDGTLKVVIMRSGLWSG
jgi:hypothetical protein